MDMTQGIKTNNKKKTSREILFDCAKQSRSGDRRVRINIPDRIRTCDLRFRKPSLYPTELRGRRLRGGRNVLEKNVRKPR